MTLRYPQVLLLLCAFNAWPMAMAADSVKLDTPVGGWRTGAPEGDAKISARPSTTRPPR